MYHTIELTADLQVALARSPRDRLERVLLRRGTLLPVQLRPHVVESVGGPMEVADLFFKDGTAVHNIPFACFSFVE
jgi:hypothetical protein